MQILCHVSGSRPGIINELEACETPKPSGFEYLFGNRGGLLMDQSVAMRQPIEGVGVRLEYVNVAEDMTRFSEPFEIFRELLTEIITPKIERL